MPMHVFVDFTSAPVGYAQGYQVTCRPLTPSRLGASGPGPGPGKVLDGAIDKSRSRQPELPNFGANNKLSVQFSLDTAQSLFSPWRLRLLRFVSIHTYWPFSLGIAAPR